jgi:hypothetical protein
MEQEEQKFKEEVMKVYEKFLGVGRGDFREYVHLIYWNMFGDTCQSYSISKFNDEDQIFLRGTNELIDERKEEFVSGIGRYSGPVQVDMIRLMNNPEFISEIKTSVEISRIGTIYYWKNMIVWLSYLRNRIWVYLFTKDREEAESFLKLVTIPKISKKKRNMYSFLVKSENGIDERKLMFDSQRIDLKKNYNDDLPWNELKEFVRSGKEGLAILYGPAGTGKTTLLKKLIQENPKKEFILINSKDLENPDSEGYLEYFLEDKNRIFILEDCEKLLLSRNQGGGSNQLVTILNMADGLLGSTLKTKFICTFNTDLRNIDEALLRKGRMRLKYYVGPLCLEKTRILANDVTIQKEMTLAEIYNQEENDFSKTSQKRIGF